MIEVPPWARLALAIAITAGITWTMVRLLHGRIMNLAHLEPEDADTVRAEPDAADAPQAAPPRTSDLAGRVLGITGVGFVFLLAFALGNFWSNNQALRQAVQDEASNLGRATAAARVLPPTQGGPLVTALADYGSSVADVEWPLLQQADTQGALVAHEAAADRVVAAVAAADTAGASNDYSWDPLTSALNDMFAAGTERITQAPTSQAPAMLALIVILGLSNLALTAAFQPAALGPNLFLMATMATITAIMLFVVIEAANPFVGGGAVEVPKFMTQL